MTATNNFDLPKGMSYKTIKINCNGVAGEQTVLFDKAWAASHYNLGDNHATGERVVTEDMLKMKEGVHLGGKVIVAYASEGKSSARRAGELLAQLQICRLRWRNLPANYKTDGKFVETEIVDVAETDAVEAHTVVINYIGDVPRPERDEDVWVPRMGLDVSGCFLTCKGKTLTDAILNAHNVICDGASEVNGLHFAK